MPWQETCPMEQRMKFVLDVQRQELSKAALCRLYGISRPTGDKWLARYAEGGVAGLRDRSRAPHDHPNQLDAAIVEAILEARGRHCSWGPGKLLSELRRRRPSWRWPAPSTIGEVLRRHGLSVPRRRRRRVAPSSRPFAACDAPNALWCADYKGWFRTGDGARCEPLTITDAFSRYLLRCQATERTDYATARRLFEAVFRQHGLPGAIRTDNGSPFASRGLAGLSRLSVWWLSLGIQPERIAPGKPQQNGRHERMHRTLKAETVSPPARTRRAQQRRFDRFGGEFNHERPHEALGQRPPASLYRDSPRAYPARPEPVTYPPGLTVRRVQKRGEFYWHHQPIFLGEAFVGQPIGLEPLDERHWLILFTTERLGVFDSHARQVLNLRQAVRQGVTLDSLRAPSGPERLEPQKSREGD